MDKIKIKKLSDIIIIEKSKDDTILKDSKLYCGCCGNQLGILKSNITFPFQSHQLIKKLKDRSFKTSIFGLRHNTCKHTMFRFEMSFKFITLENYLKQNK